MTPLYECPECELRSEEWICPNPDHEERAIECIPVVALNPPDWLTARAVQVVDEVMEHVARLATEGKEERDTSSSPSHPTEEKA